MAEENQVWPIVKPYNFGQGEQSASNAPAENPSVEDNNATGVENVRYDTVSNQGLPNNPTNAQTVVAHGVNVANPQPSASTDTDQNTSAVSAEQQQLVDATAGSDRQIKTIQDWMDAEENRPESDEERKKRERREKSKKIIAAVSDGISALSNLYFTSQYAPNMYNHDKGSISTAVGKRIDQLKADLEKKRDQYMNFSLKLGDLENQRAKTLRDLEAQQEQRRLAREKAQRDAEQHGWLAALQPDKRREQEGKANKAEQEAITAKAEADNAQELHGAKVETEKARRRSYDASAASHGRANAAEFTAWDEHGNPHQFHTATAAESFARQHGTWQNEENTSTTSSTTTDERDRVSSTSRTTTKQGGYPAAPTSEDNTPPSRRNNEDNTPPTRR